MNIFMNIIIYTRSICGEQWSALEELYQHSSDGIKISKNRIAKTTVVAL